MPRHALTRIAWVTWLTLLAIDAGAPVEANAVTLRLSFLAIRCAGCLQAIARRARRRLGTVVRDDAVRLQPEAKRRRAIGGLNRHY
jgi:hypothetical protein